MQYIPLCPTFKQSLYLKTDIHIPKERIAKKTIMPKMIFIKSLSIFSLSSKPPGGVG